MGVQTALDLPDPGAGARNVPRGPHRPGGFAPHTGFIPGDGDDPRVPLAPGNPCLGPFDHPPEDYAAEPDPAEEELGPAILGDPHGEPAGAPGPEVNDYIALAASLYASGAAQAFIERRLELQRAHGGKARTDLARGPYAIARDAYDSIAAALDRLRGRPDAESLALAARTIATAGALLLALSDAVDQAKAAAPPADPEHGAGAI